MNDLLVSQLRDAMTAAFYRQTGEAAVVKQVWIDDDGRVRVQLDDQRVGDVVNWDVGAKTKP